jgi:hypothetical protein
MNLMTTIKAILVFATVALTGCASVGVVGEFGRYNEAFSGVVTDGITDRQGMCVL